LQVSASVFFEQAPRGKNPRKMDILKIKRVVYKKRLTKAPIRDWGEEQQ
jgi:hypothetical protein